ncbi:ABC transporter ATP-binding protein [Pseudomaricurvus sp. HS19]|uniref:ABC transporter ATP-binding protein n=1 Tax=Pseudomaricurvus sp. HS19 TaxID=2692626 RepID=UPI00137172F5|nr:ABC transporter ATP-binding protein [Pseudomaricurvus sp. HS19]MYM62096.1 ATP-binding cassette domain-containing protein [Pseudomaricurvus sp. HS19]
MIELRQLCKTFVLGDQPVKALDTIDLSIGVGEYISVMGPSGSGKSTLLNMIGLLDRPDSGSYTFENAETTTMSEPQRAELRSQRMGFVFQAYHLIPRLTARENIELPMVLGRVSSAERQRRSQEVMERLGIADRSHHLPKQLSGGQRQRVALARAIICKPALLLADEPTGNLDSHSGAEVVALLEELNRDGITLLVVTHDADLGARARRQLKMLDGRIDRDLTPG